MPIDYYQIEDLDLITPRELGAGDKTNTLDPGQLYPLSVTSTGANTFDISGADLTKLRIEEDDIVHVVGGFADGDYRVQQVIDADTLEVKETVPNASSGDLTLYHRPGSERVGVDDSKLENLKGENVQEVLEDLDDGAASGPFVRNIPLGDGVADEYGWKSMGRASFSDEDYAMPVPHRLAAKIEAFALSSGKVALYEIENGQSTLVDSEVTVTGDQTLDIVIPASPNPNSERLFELRAIGENPGDVCVVHRAYIRVRTLNDELVGVHFTDADGFGAHTATAVFRLVASELVDSDSFGAHALAISLKSQLFGDPDTFGAHGLNLVLPGPSFVDGDTFGSHSATPVFTLLHSELVDGDAFGAHTANFEFFLQPTALSDGDSFGAHVMNVSVPHAHFTDSDVFGAHTIIDTEELFATLYSDGATFGASTATIIRRLLASIYDDQDAFGAHDIAVTSLNYYDDYVSSIVTVSDIVYHYRFDEDPVTDGTTVVDASPSGNDSTYNLSGASSEVTSVPTLVHFGEGTAVNIAFDSFDEIAVSPSHARFTKGGDATIGFAIKDQSPNDGYIFYESPSNGGPGSSPLGLNDEGFTIQYTSSNTVKVYLGNGTNTRTLESGVLDPAKITWVHVSLGSSGLVLYINGVSVDSASSLVMSITINEVEIMSGSQNAEGIIDEMTLVESELSASQIQQLYEAATVDPSRLMKLYTASDDNEAHAVDKQHVGQIWSYTGHASSLIGVAVDQNGYVYTGSSDLEAHKLDPDGNQVWAYTGHTGVVTSVAVDSNGYVYTTSRDDEVHKIDPDGNQVWAYTGHTNWVYGVAVDQNGYVYTASGDGSAHKLDPDGNQVWTYSQGFAVYGVAVDQNGYVYTGSSDLEAHKLDPDGNQVWAYTGHTDTVRGVFVDPDRFVYTTSDDGTVHKIDPDGNQVWAYTGHTANMNDVDAFPGRLGAFPDAWPKLLIGKWRDAYSPTVLLGFDETANSTAFDLSGNENHGSYEGNFTLNQPGIFNADKRGVDFPVSTGGENHILHSSYPATGPDHTFLFVGAPAPDDNFAFLWHSANAYGPMLDGGTGNTVSMKDAGGIKTTLYVSGSGAEMHWEFACDSSAGTTTVYANGLPFSDLPYSSFSTTDGETVRWGSKYNGEDHPVDGLWTLAGHINSASPHTDVYQRAIDLGSAPSGGHYFKSTIVDELGLATLGQQGDVICHLPLWETAGSQAVDVSMRENHAEDVGGVTFGEPPPPSASGLVSSVNLANSYLLVDGGLGVDPSSSDWTMSMWVRPDGMSENRNIFSIDDGSAFFRFSHRNTPDSDLFLSVSDGSSTETVFSSVALTQGAWVQVTLRVKASTSEADVFLDGSIIASLDWSSLTMPDLSAGSVRFGSGLTFSRFSGGLAAPVIVSQALTDAECAAL